MTSALTRRAVLANTAVMSTPDSLAAAPRADGPTGASERYDSLDLLRGIAVLAIFAVNIRNMLGPINTMFDPRYFTGPHDLTIDRVLQYAIDGKWIAVFAMLFGAGLMLVYEKSDPADPLSRIKRRQGWLLAFGLCHLLLIWPGDILTIYAILGFVLMAFLHRRTRTLLAWAAGMMAVGVGLLWLTGFAMGFMGPEEAAEISAQFAGQLAEETEALRGGVAEQLTWRIAYGATAVANIVVAGPIVLAYMLVGIALYRSGFLTARWSVPAYLGVAAAGLGTAWALDWWRIGEMGWWEAEPPEGAYVLDMFSWMWLGFSEGLIGGVGYAGLVMAAARVGFAPGPLKAAGRMAFTNYIACSLIGTTLAYGHAGGLLGEVTLAQAMMVVGATWLAILVWSPLWLRAFRFGPLEWLWRSLTYGAAQPMRR